MKKNKAIFFSAWLSLFSLIFSIIAVSNPSPASSADLSKFSAGNIISDSIFYNGSAMNAGQVQQFLNSKVPTCTINNGQPSHAAGAPWGSSTRIADVCLKDYRQPTSNMAAQPGFCSAYTGSPSESAAEIIAKVGLACNVSQKVLLVLLEKEQSLISDSWPSEAQYDHATGFACYDNGQPCVATYSGFFYQVWAAARQLQRYGNSPFTWYPVGQTSNILYQANRPECGTKAVFIENRATAALYYYTPYTPNAAALAAGYGTGDSCSAYGNRNFYQLFTDWFGTTQGLDVGAPLIDYFNANGGAQGFLGAVSATYRCGLVEDACWQKFANGAVFKLSNSQIHFVRNDYFSYWGSQGYENGWLGLPTRSTTCGLIQSACWQSFQNGAVYSSAQIGIHSVPNNVWSLYANYSYENGWLGYPKSDYLCGLVRSGCWQSFQGGYVYSTPTYGPVAFKSELWALYGSLGYENGILGYPKAAAVAINATDYTQQFEGGTITFTQTGGARLTSATDPWTNTVLTTTYLGSPTRAKACGLVRSGCWQSFQGGYVYSTPTYGPVAFKSELWALYGSLGYENGILGYPKAAAVAINATDYTQQFEGGTITFTQTGGARLTSATDPWTNTVLTTTYLGSPTRAKACGLVRSGCWQSFQGGYVYSTPTYGPVAFKSELWALYGSLGYENGILGYPKAAAVAINATDYTQQFEGGTITFTQTGGARLTSATDPWTNTVLTTTYLGSPTRAKACGLVRSGCWQSFQGGYVYSTPTYGPVAFKSELWALYGSLGYENGILGYPKAAAVAINATDYTQQFEGGTITFTQTGGARLTSATDPWTNTVLTTTYLGSPTRAKACGLVRSGCWQSFQGGYVYSTPTYGPVAFKSELWALYGSLGYENGILGYPKAAAIDNSSGYSQEFEGGFISNLNGQVSYRLK